MELKALNTVQKPLAEQVADQIAARIADEPLEPGTKLPNEFEMAQQLQVGRGTIREAIKLLASQNIVEIRRGNGTFVSENPGLTEDPLGLKFIHDRYQLAADLCDVRMMIEPETAALAATNASDEEIAEIEAQCRAVEERYEHKGDHVEADRAFHAAIAKASGNSVIPNLSPVIQTGISLLIDVTKQRLKEETLRTHRAILDAIKAHQPEAAREAMREHLRYNRERVEQLAQNKDEAVS